MHSTNTDKGEAVFIEPVKMINEVYTEGSIRIRLYPFIRSIKNVEDGTADFHLPFIHAHRLFQQHLRYRPIQEPIGRTL